MTLSLSLSEINIIRTGLNARTISIRNLIAGWEKTPQDPSSQKLIELYTEDLNVIQRLIGKINRSEEDYLSDCEHP
jgi:hypothetical protein